MRLKAGTAALLSFLAVGLLTGAAGARADVIGAFGANDVRSDGILLANDGFDGVRDLDLLRSTGTTLYRGRMRLDCVDPAGTGNFDFASRDPHCSGLSYDDLMASLSRRGMTYTPVLINFGTGIGGPYRPLPPGRIGGPELSRFAAFAAAAARRYGPGGSFWASCGCPPHPIKAWEIWNEQNNGWWWDGGASAADYATVFAATRAALRSADAQARTVVGGMTYDRNGEASYVAPEQMIAALAAHNANAFDAVALHPYTDARGMTPDAIATDAMTYVQQLASAVRAATGPGPYNGPRQQIWLTELGWSDVDASPAIIGDALGEFSMQLDAGAREAYNVGPSLWYMLRDSATKGHRDDQLGMRFTTASGADSGAKPVWSAYASVVQQSGTVQLPPALADTGPYVEPPPAPAVRRTPTRLTVRARAVRGGVRLAVTCATSATRCSGRARLDAQVAIAAAGRPRRIVVGSKAVRVAGGKTRTVRVSLKRGLRPHKRLRVRVRIRATDSAGSPATATTTVVLRGRHLR